MGVTQPLQSDETFQRACWWQIGRGGPCPPWPQHCLTSAHFQALPPPLVVGGRGTGTLAVWRHPRHADAQDSLTPTSSWLPFEHPLHPVPHSSWLPRTSSSGPLVSSLWVVEPEVEICPRWVQCAPLSEGPWTATEPPAWLPYPKSVGSSGPWLGSQTPREE